MRAHHLSIPIAIAATFWLAAPAAAAPFLFSTGSPDGRIATLSRPASAGQAETETADDFTLRQATQITHATFTGLLPAGAALSSVNRVEIELYHIFPRDSVTPPAGNVLTRTNSPSDNQFETRDSALGTLTFATTLLNSSFTAANSVVNGVNPVPNQRTGGDGPVTGQEVQFDVDFTVPLDLAADYDFFRPEVGLDSGSFLWLSATGPVVPPAGTPPSDLQTWMRSPSIAPDWERPGADIVGSGAFNAAFSLSGTTTDVPEPASAALLLAGIGGLLVASRSRQQAI